MDKLFLQELANRLAGELKMPNSTRLVQSRFEKLCLLGMKDSIAESLRDRGTAGFYETQADIRELEKQLFFAK